MFHFQKEIGDWPVAVRRLPDGALIKQLEQTNMLAEAKRINSTLKTVYRKWFDSSQIFGGTDAEILARVRDYFNQVARVMGSHVDYVEEWNEYLPHSLTPQQVQDRIRHVRIACDEWESHWRYKWPQAPKLVLANQFVWNDIPYEIGKIAVDYEYPIDYHAYTLWINGIRAANDWTDCSGRWERMEQQWGLKPLWMFNETGPFMSASEGWQDVLFGNEELYVQAMRTVIRDWMNTNAGREGRILGFAIFTTGSTDWGSYETDWPEIGMLADMIKEEWKPGSIVPPPPPPSEEIIGIDVSHWQGDIDFSITAGKGVKFAFCKLTESDYHVDSMAGIYLDDAEDYGIKRGVYHFYRPLVDPVAQAEHFLNTLRDVGHLELPMAIDVEDRVGADHTLADKVRKFAGIVEMATGRKPLIYTNYYYANDFLSSLGTEYDLWLAQYNDQEIPNLPSGWANWRFWQFTSSAYGPDYGASSARIDVDRWNGTLEELEAYASEVPAPPPQRELYEVTAYKLNIRLGPDISATDRGDLIRRDVVESVGEPEDGFRPVKLWVSDRWLKPADGMTTIYMPVIGKAPVKPEQIITFPIGTPGEREEATEGLPGNWISANGYANYYKVRTGAYHYHTGDDYNLNVPRWDSDRGMPVYAIAHGTATFVGEGSGWGKLVVIRHHLLDGRTIYSRYSAIDKIAISEGQVVSAGQKIAIIDQHNPGEPYHLHFDISISDVLEHDPTHWPGTNLKAVSDHYVSPTKFIIENRK